MANVWLDSKSANVKFMELSGRFRMLAQFAVI